MQKLKKNIISIIGAFFMFLASVFLFSCGDGDADKKLKSITITSDLKDTFFVGEKIDFSSAQFDVEFVNGEVLHVTMQDKNMESNYTEINNKNAEEQTVIFIYRISATDAVYKNFIVHFIEDEPVSLSIDSSQIASAIKQNDVLDLTPLTGVCTYQSGKEQDLTYSDFTFSSFNTKTVGKLEIEVMYKNKFATLSIMVIAHSLKFCEPQGVTSTYSVGEEISFKEIRLQLTLDDDSQVYVFGPNNVRYETDVNNEKAGLYYVQFFYIGNEYSIENEDNAKTQIIQITVE